MNVVPLFGEVLHDIAPEEVLEKAKDWDMSKCLVVGPADDGTLVLGGSTSEMITIIGMLTMALWQVQESTQTE